jgi:WD40 repeat protein
VAAGRTARVLGTRDGQERWAAPNTHPRTVTRIATAGDRWVATGCTDRKARLLDATAGTEVFSAEADGDIRDLTFSPRGTLLVTADAYGTVLVVDPAAASVRARFSGNFPGALVAVSPDDSVLAVAWDDEGHTVSCHDLTTAGAPEVRRLAHSEPVAALAFAPAGALHVAAGPTVVATDPGSGAELVRLPHPEPVRHIGFSGDGTLVVTACEDDVVRVLVAGTATP